MRSIAEAPVVVADLTGANANVYYEIGLAHAFRRPVLAFIIEEQRPQFDLGQQRAIPVRLDERGDLADKEALQDKVRAALVALDVDKGIQRRSSTHTSTPVSLRRSDARRVMRQPHRTSGS